MNKRFPGQMTAMAVLGLLCTAFTVGARPSVDYKYNTNQRSANLKTTAASCDPATATIDLDINNVRARLMDGGDMWWDQGTGTAKYEIPKGSGKNSLFAGSIWVGGLDPQGILKVAAQLYRQKGNDYWPGPTQTDKNNLNSAPDKSICSEWDRFWKVDAATITEFREYVTAHGGGDPNLPNDPKFASIIQWPATGNFHAKGTSGQLLQQLLDTASYIHFGRTYAPFVDHKGAFGGLNREGFYDPEYGDYPDIFGDQYVWWVFNDMGNAKLQTNTNAIGMEVQTGSFAYSSKDYLNDASFVFYKLINRGTLKLDSTFMATWTDADLGDYSDDYIGCDTSRSLGILYNGKSVDGTGKATDYGAAVPMIGVDFFQGPKKRAYSFTRSDYFNHPTTNGRFFHEDTLGMTVFNYFTASDQAHSDPQNGIEHYYIMTGSSRLGVHLHNDFVCGQQSSGFGSGPDVKSVFWGEPNKACDWSECQCKNNPGDRRFVHSSGPFNLEAGGITNDIIIGACWVPNVGGCPNASFTNIRAADDAIQELFDNHFKQVEGPNAPRLKVQALDRKLVCYILNDNRASTNYMERFGYYDSSYYRFSTPYTRNLARFADSAHKGDSLYKFEGYRVFQLKNKDVSVASIFNSDFSVNQNVAKEVFETDIKNDFSGNLVNHIGVPNIAAGEYNAFKLAELSNKGLVHSFELTTDAFATGQDKRFVNYRNYYFVAIAFAANRFRPYSPKIPDSTAKIEYYESAHGPDGPGTPIPVVSAMPNPANGNMGTTLNADYGTGVIIKRLEGIGNGATATSFDSATEAEILSKYQVYEPVYKQGEGPVNIKVVDPDSVKVADWELYLTGPVERKSNGTASGQDIIKDSTGSWKLVSSLGDTIYSEQNINTTNEQIIKKYGLSLTINQVGFPGEATTPQNGYISSTLMYADPNKAWLAGVQDKEEIDPRNWIRAGGYVAPDGLTCDYSDNGVSRVNGRIIDANVDGGQVYEGLLSDYTLNKGTWAPAALGAAESKADCGFGVASAKMFVYGLQKLRGVDIVFTSDKSKWSKCVVFEMQDEPGLAEGRGQKFRVRRHKSWTGNIDAAGKPVYATSAGDTGFSYFPGYVINASTGERLNVVFGEDSYLKSQNGDDMIWNPTSTILGPSGSVIFGGKHTIYILNSKYDEDAKFAQSIDENAGLPEQYSDIMWIGVPTIQAGQTLRPLSEGLIPTETRIRLRVTHPYGTYHPDPNTTERNNGLPLYSFSTRALAPTPLTDQANVYYDNKQALLDQIHVTPNPYYAYTGYEESRLDTRVRIVNLPRAATINIYALDGTLIRTLTKDNPYLSYIDWDTRNTKGLAIASGMYLIHVKAEGIGETVIRWFGAMRPTDITTY